MAVDNPRAVSVSLQKGGVGKTTLAINLVDRLAARGHDVLLVDLDQQGNATEGVGLGKEYTNETHLGQVLKGDVDPQEIIKPAHGFSVVPANREFDELATHVQSATMGRRLLDDSLVSPLLGNEYDYIVIDSPPNINALSDAGILAAKNLMVPLLMREASVGGFERMIDQQVKPIRNAGIDLDILAIVPNRLRGDGEEKRILTDLEDSPFTEKLPSFARSNHFDDPESPGPGIRERVALSRAYRDGVPLSEYDPESDMLPRLDELAVILEKGGVSYGR